ncbi:VCBS repeat-containing protein [Chryseolinea lacunae]|uniref:VCBS repeat-containing protein n=1 Tax=Chryseolinea lacunae TaxID=2801331 RepID=A0ABS1KME5_9BACT|nr:VCBS repeat-containing protein [Chryseolinea lacunae]MBL0740658.1 VCBS repeat-containing protein [Chryseolinea lacunae]
MDLTQNIRKTSHTSRDDVKTKRSTGLAGLLMVFLFSCTPEKKETLFSDLDPDDTGIEFRNDLVETDDKNVLSYIYFYNGGGVAAGDLNNDGLADLVFTGNQKQNAVYINKGNFAFDDISQKSGIQNAGGWSTGVVLVDINGDGWNDIYICRSGDIKPENRKNRLYINNKDQTFTEKAAAYGLDDTGYSTHAAFFDYDKDGDLDMFLLNHSIHYFPVDNQFTKLKNTTSKDFGSKLYQNNNNVFVDVSEKAGIVSNVISFGLGVAVGDVDNNGWPDIYVSNDFKEQDYLYMNNGNGTFTNELEKRMDHISLFSMGSDMEDVNNDGLLDLMTLDMLPPDNLRLKLTAGAENFDKFKILNDAGFYWQYMRNMFHINNGDGTFSEIGSLSGISNTDWSWTPLFADFDNDGSKDLFVTNGYARDYTNMDFMKFMVDYQNRVNATGKELTFLELIAKMPSSELNNHIYKNNGDLTFASKNTEWGFEKKGISSGASYADLDNDGDLDLVVNNINDFASVYQNNSELLAKNNYVRVRLMGTAGNTQALGAKVQLFAGNLKLYREHFLSRGYESSVDDVITFGIGKKEKVDSVVITWPDGKHQTVKNPTINSLVSIKENGHEPGAAPKPVAPFFMPAVDKVAFLHQENQFNDFKVQTLLPHFLSRFGPCMTKADVNGDGLEDFFVGGAKGFAGQLFVQTKTGGFKNLPSKALEADATSEDVDALFFDCDKDGDQDLYVVSGGFEFVPGDAALQDRLYINDGRGNFVKNKSLPPVLVSKSCVKPIDFDKDGDLDLFVGGRLISGSYPTAPASFLFENDGKGNLEDVSQNFAGGVSPGMIADAAVADLNGDQWPDLIMAGEWTSIKVFINTSGKFTEQTEKYITQPSNGWWNKILSADFDNDGDIDFIVGNLGVNAQIRADEATPSKLFYADIDKNGSIDPILTFFVDGISYPSPYLDDLISQVPSLKKKYLYYKNYAVATSDSLMAGKAAADVPVVFANKFQSVVLKNEGNKLQLIDLPVQAQFSPVFSILKTDANKDGLDDIILTGNLTQTRVRFGRYDANHGMLFLGDGKCGFKYVPQYESGLKVRGDVRSSIEINDLLIFGVNSDSVRAFRKSR